MAFDGTAWDETTPTNSNLANEIDDNMRDMKTGVRGRMAMEHLWPSSQAATNESGLHKYITFVGQTSTPSLVIGTNTQKGVLFVNDTTKSLVFVASDSSETIIVSGSTETGGMMPPGAILAYAAAASPTGWIMCTGGAFSRTTYSRLFGAIGTVYGTGDGSTTFNVPDIRGRIPVGKSASGSFGSLATTVGAETHTLTIAEMPAHTHSATAREAGGSGTAAIAAHTVNDGTPHNITDAIGSTGGGGAHNNIQPSIVVNYIIKF